MSLRWTALLWLGLAVVALLPFALANSYILHILIMICIVGSFALSLNLVLQMGQLSFAQAGFMGIGAYTSAILSSHWNIPPMITTLAGGCLASIIAGITGPIFLRIKGTYFVLLTFCFAQIVNLIFQDQVEWFGGNNGLTGIVPYSLGEKPLTIQASYVAGLVLLAACYYVCQSVSRSEFGTVLASLEENEKLSESFGLSAIRYRILTYALSAFIAGLCGAFYAHYLGFINPEAFSTAITVQALIINVVGGLNLPLGVLIGSFIIVPLPELFRDTKQYQTLAYGLALMAMLLFARNGLLGLFAPFRPAGKR